MRALPPAGKASPSIARQYVDRVRLQTRSCAARSGSAPAAECWNPGQVPNHAEQDLLAEVSRSRACTPWRWSQPRIRAIQVS